MFTQKFFCSLCDHDKPYISKSNPRKQHFASFETSATICICCYYYAIFQSTTFREQRKLCKQVVMLRFSLSKARLQTLRLSNKVRTKTFLKLKFEFRATNSPRDVTTLLRSQWNERKRGQLLFTTAFDQIVTLSCASALEFLLMRRRKCLTSYADDAITYFHFSFFFLAYRIELLTM